MCVTFEALKRGINMTFRQVMTQELDISLNFLSTQDFYEGIRSQLIDKDRNPKWSHLVLTKFPPHKLNNYFVKQQILLRSLLHEQSSIYRPRQHGNWYGNKPCKGGS